MKVADDLTPKQKRKANESYRLCKFGTIEYAPCQGGHARPFGRMVVVVAAAAAAGRVEHTLRA